MPLIFKAEGAFRSTMHFQKLTAILLTAPKTKTANEGLWKFFATDRRARASLCVCSQYLWVLFGNDTQTALLNWRENRGVRNWFRERFVTSVQRIDQYSYDGSCQEHIIEGRTSLFLEYAEAELANLWRCLWVEVYEVDLRNNNQQDSTSQGETEPNILHSLL